MYSTISNKHKSVLHIFVKCNLYTSCSAHLRIIMKEGVWEKEAMKLVTPSRATKGTSRPEQRPPQVPEAAMPTPATHRHPEKFCRDTHTRYMEV